MTLNHIQLTIEVGSTTAWPNDDDEILICKVTYPAELVGEHHPLTVDYLRPDIQEGLHQGILRATTDIQQFLLNPQTWLSSSQSWRRWQEAWQRSQEYRHKAEQLAHEYQYYQGLYDGQQWGRDYWRKQLLTEGRLPQEAASTGDGTSEIQAALFTSTPATPPVANDDGQKEDE